MDSEKDTQKPKHPKNDPYGCDTPRTLDIQASSSTECTGLIPAQPESLAEIEAYNDLYPFMPPVK